MLRISLIPLSSPCRIFWLRRGSARLLQPVHPPRKARRGREHMPYMPETFHPCIRKIRVPDFPAHPHPTTHHPTRPRRGRGPPGRWQGRVCGRAPSIIPSRWISAYRPSFGFTSSLSPLQYPICQLRPRPTEEGAQTQFELTAISRRRITTPSKRTGGDCERLSPISDLLGSVQSCKSDV